MIFSKKNLLIGLIASSFIGNVFGAPGPLTVLVSASPTAAPVGSDVTISVKVTNTGSSAANSNTIDVLLPAGVTEVSHVAPGGTTYTSGVPGISPSVWSSINLGAGASSILMITVTITGPDFCSFLMPVATVASALSMGVFNGCTILVQCPLVMVPSKPISAETEPDAIVVYLTNTTSSTISGVNINITLPAGVTQGSVTPPVGTYTPGTPNKWNNFNLASGASEILSIPVTINSGTAAMTLVSTATITSPVSFVHTATTGIEVLSTFLDWSKVTFDQNGMGNFTVCATNPTTICIDNYATTDQFYTESYATQGVGCTLNAIKVSPNHPTTIPFQILTHSSANLGTVFGLRVGVFNPNDGLTPQNQNSTPPSPSTSVTAPIEYCQATFSFDPVIYPTGLGNLSFFVYDIDSDDGHAIGFRDALVVWGLDATLTTSVIPNVILTPVSQIYEYSSGIPVGQTNVGAAILCSNGTSNLNGDDPRGLAIYQFPSRVRQVIIRYYNQTLPWLNLPSAGSLQGVDLSNLYNTSIADLAVTVDVSAAVQSPCTMVTYTVCAYNDGPTDAQNVNVRGILPVGLTFVSSVTDQGSFDVETNNWFVGDLDNNQVTCIEVTAMVNESSANMTLVQTVTVYSPIVVDNNPINDTATFSIEVGPLMKPTVVDQFISTPQATPVTINVLDGSTLPCAITPVTITSAPIHGVLMPITPESGIFSYRPSEDYVGADMFTYQVCCVNGCCSSASVMINVTSSTVVPPQAFNDSAITNENVPVTIPVVANDVAGTFPLNPASVSTVSSPSNGTVTYINPVTGAITYTPNPGYTGTDEFMYQVCDTMGNCSIATVFITIESTPSNIQTLINVFCHLTPPILADFVPNPI